MGQNETDELQYWTVGSCLHQPRIAKCVYCPPHFLIVTLTTALQCQATTCQVSGIWILSYRSDVLEASGDLHTVSVNAGVVCDVNYHFTGAQPSNRLLDGTSTDTLNLGGSLFSTGVYDIVGLRYAVTMVGTMPANSQPGPLPVFEAAEVITQGFVDYSSSARMILAKSGSCAALFVW